MTSIIPPPNAYSTVAAIIPAYGRGDKRGKTANITSPATDKTCAVTDKVLKEKIRDNFIEIMSAIICTAKFTRTILASIS